MAKKCGIQTPDGYFDSLQSRLVSIAETAPSVRKVGFARKVAPYFAYAASLVAAVLLGISTAQYNKEKQPPDGE